MPSRRFSTALAASTECQAATAVAVLGEMYYMRWQRMTASVTGAAVA